MLKSILVFLFLCSSLSAVANNQGNVNCLDKKTLITINTMAATVDDYRRYLGFIGFPGVIAKLNSGGDSAFIEFDTRIAPIDMLNDQLKSLATNSRNIVVQTFCDRIN